MAKKTKQTPKRPFPDDVRESAHKIWLAGLGALTVAKEEGTELFRNLVEKGESFETEGREKAEEVKTKVEETASKVKDEATSIWSKVDRKVDDAVTTALGRAGIPTRDEIATLSTRVEELTRLVDQLQTKKK